MTTSFPNESAAYRAARDRLLAQETELRRAIEAVAAARRELPPGGVVPEDYVFQGPAGDVKLSQLFTAGKDTLVVYNFMFGPDMDHACSGCSTVLDSLDGAAEHLAQHVDFVVVAKSPLPRILAFAETRGWRRLRLLSSASNSFNRDYHGEDEKGSQEPMLNVFQRNGETIRHFWGSELLYAPTEPGQHMRHNDLVTPLWGMLDLTPAGRGGDWMPKLRYD